jgi:hypothetical protein
MTWLAAAAKFGQVQFALFFTQLAVTPLYQYDRAGLWQRAS